MKTDLHNQIRCPALAPLSVDKTSRALNSAIHRQTLLLLDCYTAIDDQLSI